MSSHHRGCAVQLHMFDYEKQENPELTDDTTVFAAGFNDTSNTFVTAAGRDVKVRTHVNTGRKPCVVLTTCALVGGWWPCPWAGVECHLWRLVAEVSSLAGRRLDRLLLGRPQAQVCDWRPPRWCSCLRLPQRLPPEDAVPTRRRGEYGGGSATLLWWLCRITHTHTGWFGSQVTKLKYCARDKTVISASRDLTIVVSDESLADKGALLKEIKGGHTSEIGAMDFSCHLSLIASGCHDGLLCVWDYEFGKLSNLCLGHTSGASSRYPPPLLLLLLLCIVQPQPSSTPNASCLCASHHLRGVYRAAIAGRSRRCEWHRRHLGCASVTTGWRVRGAVREQGRRPDVQRRGRRRGRHRCAGVARVVCRHGHGG